MSDNRPEPLKGKTLYTARVLTDDTASTTFVSKKVYEQFDSCGGRYELFEKDKVKSAVEWLKEKICEGKPYGICFEEEQRQELMELVDEAFPDLKE